MMAREILDKIFKDPKTTYELTEFDNLGKPISDIVNIYPKTSESGRDGGKTKYFMKSFVKFSSGKEEVQVFDENGKSNPEEIVRQLWVYKLLNTYQYKEDEIELEKNVHVYTLNNRDEGWIAGLQDLVFNLYFFLTQCEYMYKIVME